MKQFLVITSSRSVSTRWEKREAYVRDFYAALEAKLDDVKVRYTTYDDIDFLVQDGAVRIHDNKHDVDLKDVDIVHFKNWMFDYEEAATIAYYLKYHGVTFFNEEVGADLAWGKNAQMCRLAMQNLPVPDSYFAKKARLKQAFADNALPMGFEFPLILKADDGAKGNDNHLIASAEEALNVLNEAAEDKEFIVQTYHPNEGDYRYLFMGFDQDPLVFHRKGVEESHLNNTSRGGQGTFLDLTELPAEYLRIARQAAVILKRQISGVDLLVDLKTNKVYVLEVNSTPALATGYGIDRKNEKFAEFLASQLEVAEEEE